MIDTTSLLEYICQDADMGRSATAHVVKHCKDEALRTELSRQHNDYEKAYSHAAGELEKRGAPTPDAKTMTKMMANASADLHTLVDDSPSKIAELMIQGNTMGITSMLKQIHAYDGADKNVLDMAHKQVALQQTHIEALKKYL